MNRENQLRAQLSLELLIVMAALLAFFLAFIPAIRAVDDIAGYAMKEKQMQFVFGKICGLVEEAGNLGKGAELEASAYFPVDLELHFFDGKLIGWYEISGRKGKVWKELDYLLKPERQIVRVGGQLLRAENLGNAISIDFAAEKG